MGLKAATKTGELMASFRSSGRRAAASGASPEGATRVRVITFLAVGLAFAMAFSGLIVGQASADSCVPGWTKVSDQDNSFTWQAVGLGAVDSVAWSGSVQLLINYDKNCYVLGLQAVYTGPLSGGTLTLTGSPLVSFTVQYPDAFTSYSGVGLNAYGDLASWNPPAGTYPTYVVKTVLDINARGADEFDITGGGIPGVVSNVQATFSLPVELLGKTIKAQVHVGPDKCQCKVTDVNVPAGQAPPGLWSVHVHAHEDDWQLFESPNVTNAYTAGYHLLFIYVTAGDGGAGQSVWGAREESAMASVRHIVGTASESTASVSICYTVPAPTCHTMWQWNYGTTVSIFMRLPDGNTDGGGFAAYGFQSLAKLRDGNISSMSAVDGSTTYNSWGDLWRTLGAIVTTFAPNDATARINAPDFNRTRQSYEGKSCSGCADHSDHLSVADAVYAVTVGAGAPWSRQWYIDYPICWADSRYPVNLDATAYQMKKDTFMAYNDRLKQLTGVDTYASQPSFWENCFQREYSRSV